MTAERKLLLDSWLPLAFPGCVLRLAPHLTLGATQGSRDPQQRGSRREPRGPPPGWDRDPRTRGTGGLSAVAHRGHTALPRCVHTEQRRDVEVPHHPLLLPRGVPSVTAAVSLSTVTLLGKVPALLCITVAQLETLAMGYPCVEVKSRDICSMNHQLHLILFSLTYSNTG